MDTQLSPSDEYEIVGDTIVCADGRRLPVIRGGAFGDPETPAEQEGAEAPAEGDGTETPAEGGETSAEDAAPDLLDATYVLADDVESWDDDRLVAQHTEVEAQRVTALAELQARRDAGTATIGHVEAVRSIRAAGQRIADILAARGAERTAIADGIDEAGAPVELPEGFEAPAERVASARQVVTRVIGERPPAVGEQSSAEGQTDEERLAAAQPVPWRDARLGEGTPLDWSDVVNASATRQGGRVQQRGASILASIAVPLDESRTLNDSRSHNERVLAEIREDYEARRADAAGDPERLAAICDPPTIIRDAVVIGTDAMPFQATLPQAGAVSGNQLKFEYRLPTSLAEATPGIGTWSTALQAAIDPTDPDTWKPTVRIDCPEYDDETAVEQTASYEIDAFTQLSSPEAEADFIHAKDRAFARHLEGWMLRRFDKYTHNVAWDASDGPGAGPQVIEAILSALANGRYAERIDLASGYVVAGSPGLLAALTVDENKRGYRQSEATLAQVQSIIEGATGSRYVELLDVAHTDDDGTWGSNPFGALPAVGLDDTPDPLPRLGAMTHWLRVYNPAAFAQINTGEMTFGQQVTLDQARQNVRGFFQRTFGGLMKPGYEPAFTIKVTGLHLDGSRGGFTTPISEGGGS